MLIIRKFKKEDARKISNLIRKCLIEVNSKDYPKKVIKYQYQRYSSNGILTKSKDSITIVVTKNGNIIGTGSLRDNWISGVFVDPTLHRQGTGKKIMNYLENLAKKNGFQQIKLGSSITAFGFYKKIGYKKVKELVDKDLGKVILMRKFLR